MAHIWARVPAIPALRMVLFGSPGTIKNPTLAKSRVIVHWFPNSNKSHWWLISCKLLGIIIVKERNKSEGQVGLA